MIWKLLIFAIAGYALYRLFINDRKKADDNSKKEHEKLIASGQLIQDPICGTYVDPQSSISVKDGDIKYHFCSHECRDKFLQNKS